MFRFVHSADWQLGARFSQFSAKGARLREARLETLRKSLELGRSREADAFIVAGDLFEDNQVDEALVTRVLELFRDYAPLPIFLLPGNHDPFTGPDSVWARKGFLKAPEHVHVLAQPGVTDLGHDTFLVSSPLQQKLSTIDPSQRLVDLAAGLPPDAVKIGVTHGALAIEGKHQPNDFPIALNAASRAGLDYLAVGHWHNWLADLDGGRIVMPGTPEPDRFDLERGGQVALVEIDPSDRTPKVTPLSVATLTWSALAFDFLSADASRANVEQILGAMSATADRSVVRVTMTGSASPKLLAEQRAWLTAALAPFLVGQIVDQTRVALSTAEIQDLELRHPILAQVLADIDQIETLATGRNTSGIPISGSAPFTLAEAQALLAPSRIDLANLTADHLAHTRQLLLQALQEVSP